MDTEPVPQAPSGSLNERGIVAGHTPSATNPSPSSMSSPPSTSSSVNTSPSNDSGVAGVEKRRGRTGWPET
ncbi:hypothetical protein SK128_016784, partial [Halocaridina rubra]